MLPDLYGAAPASKSKDHRLVDRELALRIKQGDRDAFEGLFRAYAAPLFRFACRYMRSHEAAEDLVQDVFVHLWLHRDKWAVPDSLNAYLYRMARNRALDQIKHATIVARWKNEAGRLEEQSAEPVDALLHSGELARRVDDIIASLPEHCRTAFVLSRNHGLSYREIAQVMQISVKTVETQMSRAFTKLKKGLAIYDRSVVPPCRQTA